MSVSLHVGGVRLTGFTDIRVSSSLESVAREFSFGVATAAEFKLSSGWIRPGTPVEVKVDDDVVATGYVVTNDYQYDSTSTTFTVSGSGKTVDLIDSDVVAKPNRWRKRTIRQIVEDLLFPHGIGLQYPSVVDVTKKVSRFKVSPGTTVFAALDQLLEDQGLLMTDTADGDLYLTRVDADNLPATLGGAIVYGENVLSGRFRGDGSGLFSEYVCKGQRSGTDDDNGAAIALVSASVTDQAIGRYRPKLIRARRRTTRERAKQLARWTAANASGRAAECVYTVGGWRQAGGKLWQAGQLVPVRDPRVGIDATLLVVDVDFVLSPDEGRVTQLVLAPPAAYELLGPDETRRRKVKRKTKTIASTFSLWGQVDAVVKERPELSGTAGLDASVGGAP
jgi:prophage tail gpP-like protein